MKSELSDGMSNHSDFSNDSQNSQISNVDFLTLGSGILLGTPSAVSTFCSYLFTFYGRFVSGCVLLF